MTGASRFTCFSSAISKPIQILDVLAKSNASVLSVDLFDTMVFRTCCRPAVVFEIHYYQIHHLLPNFMQPSAWVAQRRRAEHRITVERAPEEVTLSEIYREISRELSLPTDLSNELLRAELECEAAVIRPFINVTSLLDEVQRQGIRVVINTDTYLPYEFISKLVHKFLQFSPQILCSSETRKPKRSGLAYTLLKEQFKNERILHLGDNAHSDVFMAERNGIEARLVNWGRERWFSRNALYEKALKHQSVLRIETPLDGLRHGDGEPQAELAWRWAIVLLDFLAVLRNYIREVEPDEVWLLSRDMETINNVLLEHSEILGPAKRKYVFTSRATTYPIFAVIDPVRFASLTGAYPTESDVAEGKSLIAAYSSQIDNESSRILVVDVGWKGRFQLALKQAFPDTKIFGYYFSLDGDVDPSITPNTRCFLAWDPAKMWPTAIECLFGYRGSRCAGYKQEERSWQPVFAQSTGDVAPTPYCEYLAFYLSLFLANKLVSDVKAGVPTTSMIVERTCMYPDDVVARAFEKWHIADHFQASTGGLLTTGGRAGKLDLVLGRVRNGNLWPSLASWRVGGGHRILAETHQRQIHFRKVLTSWRGRNNRPKLLK